MQNTQSKTAVIIIPQNKFEVDNFKQVIEFHRTQEPNYENKLRKRANSIIIAKLITNKITAYSQYQKFCEGAEILGVDENMWNGKLAL